MKLPTLSILRFMAAAAACLALPQSLSAANNYWENTSVEGGYWNVAENWSLNAVPTAADVAYFNDGSHAIVNTSGNTVARLYLGKDGTTGNRLIIESGGTVTAPGVFSIGGGSGELTIEVGGSLATPGGVYIGNTEATSEGTVNVHGNWDTAFFYLGYYGKGTVNVDGGTLAASSGINIGRGVGSNGTLNVMNGGSMTTTASLQVGVEGSGEVNVNTGGTLTVNAGAGNLTLGTNANAVKAAVTIGGAIGESGPTTALAAGTLNATAVSGAAAAEDGVSTLNFNHTSTNYKFQRADGTDVHIQNKVAVHVYAGTTILESTNNNYTGGTTIHAGTLLVNNVGSNSGTGTGAVNVEGGILGGSGKITGLITLGKDGFVAPGSAAGSVGTLTASEFTWEGGGTMVFNLGTTDALSDRLTLTTLNKGADTGLWNFSFGDGAAAPTVNTTYTLITFTDLDVDWNVNDFTSTYSGSLPGVQGAFTLASNALTFTVTSAIPEPGTSAMVMLGGLLIAFTAFKRRRQGVSP